MLFGFGLVGDQRLVGPRGMGEAVRLRGACRSDERGEGGGLLLIDQWGMVQMCLEWWDVRRWNVRYRLEQKCLEEVVEELA